MLAGQFTKTILSGTHAETFSIHTIICISFLMVVSQALLGYALNKLSRTTGERIILTLRNRLFSHLQFLPVSILSHYKHGELLSLITNDCGILSFFAANTLSILPSLVISSSGALFAIFLINPLISVLLALFIPFYFFLLKISGRKIRPYSHRYFESYSRMVSCAEENLSNISLTKLYTLENIEERNFGNSNQSFFESSLQIIHIQSILSPFFRVLSFTSFLVILGCMGIKAHEGSLLPEQIVTILGYGLVLTGPFGQLANVYGILQQSISACERVQHIFSITAENLLSGHCLNDVTGEIEFKNISFSYPDRPQLFENFNLHIAPGETIAITGKNGSGKSSLVSLLVRFYEPQQGKILLDGMDVNALSLLSLRSNIGIVQQQVLLKNCSILENIRMGKENASIDEIREAAAQAQALEFIETFPAGFSTLVGDKGIRLSGGQKQRLSLARALLKNPQILIFDEATAMFDPKGELDFIEKTRNLLQNKTVIIITHRQAVLDLADRHVVLHEGKILEPEMPSSFCSLNIDHT